MKNGNSRRKLEEIKTSVLKGLSKIAPAPGAQFAPVPARHQIVSAVHEHVMLFTILAPVPARHETIESVHQHVLARTDCLPLFLADIKLRVLCLSMYQHSQIVCACACQILSHTRCASARASLHRYWDVSYLLTLTLQLA